MNMDVRQAHSHTMFAETLWLKQYLALYEINDNSKPILAVIWWVNFRFNQGAKYGGPREGWAPSINPWDPLKASKAKSEGGLKFRKKNKYFILFYSLMII